MTLCDSRTSLKTAFAVLLVLLAVLFTAVAPAFAQPTAIDKATARKYRELMSAVSLDGLKGTVRYLSNLPTRYTGYPGCQKAADYIYEQMRGIGLQEVRREEFFVPVPVEKTAYLTVKGVNRKIKLHALYPNLVRTPQLPPQGLDAPLIYSGGCSLREFNGKKVEGSICLAEFNSGNKWENVFRLGAKGVIFIEPDETLRGEVEAKFVSIPIDTPRYLIGREDADYLVSLLNSQSNVQINVKCEMPWEKRLGTNIIGVVPGSNPQLKDQVVIIEAYYDSTSIVPSMAPGAESSLGIAAMLELAKLVKAQKPARTVMFLATSGHFQALSGMRAWISKHYTELHENRLRVAAFLALDISSMTQNVGLFYKGMFYDEREDIQRDFADFARVCRETSEQIALTMGVEPTDLFSDAVNPVAGKPWRVYLPGKIALDNEPFTLGGGMGMAFVTTNDARPTVDTPYDTFEKVRFKNVLIQTRFLAALFDKILNDASMPVRGGPHFDRLFVTGGFARVNGRIVEFDPTVSFFPDSPIPKSLAVYRSSNKTLMGVKGDIIEMVGETGEFSMDGIPPSNAYDGKRPVRFEAYKLDEKTGGITYAPDRGAQGATIYPLEFPITSGIKGCTLVVFKCQPMQLFELVDPQSLRALPAISVFRARTETEPRKFGYAITQPEAWVSHVDAQAVVFGQPQEEKIMHDENGKPFTVHVADPDSLKIVMSAGPAAKRLLLLNTTEPDPDDPQKRPNPIGIGYRVDQWPSIYFTPLKVATDMYNLDDMRIAKLAAFRIINKNINNLHELCAEELEKAKSALDELRYDEYGAHARAAWGYEARGYPDVEKTANDVVKGVLFYLALLLPFAFFMERLLFAFRDIKQQIFGMLLVFGAVFIIFRFVHPAFNLTMNPVIVLLAFIMIVLAAVVIIIIINKFEEQLKEMHRAIAGSHTADIGRMSVAAAAFSLGVSNMRRRKARTILTATTLVLVTFIVLSFTSVEQSIRLNKVPSPGIPLYNGIMVRDAMWRPLETSAFQILNDEFASKNRAVSPRAWFYAAELGEQSFVQISNLSTGAKYDARSLVGLSSEETRVTGVESALASGRWFEPGEMRTCILPGGVATGLGVTDANLGSARIQIMGMVFTVIGILNDESMKRLTDLDEEMLTPVDFILMQRMQSGGSQSAESAGFREYLHLAPDQTVVLPYETLINMGGTLRSVAIDFATPKEVNNVLQLLMKRLGFNLYAGMGGRTFKFSSIATQSVTGLADLIIPLLIAALIVLNTMLGAVFERTKEIHIFGSIGLAPSHVGVLFIAESTVYAVMGAILGYLLGQIIAKLSVYTGWLEGLSLNYSSMAAIVATIVVMAVVLLSTIYPAKKASSVATPGVERRWKVTDPEGDTWIIPLPFSVTGDQAMGLNAFLSEWFAAYEEYSIGDFVTEGTTFSRHTHEYGEGFEIELMAWLAPFDLGVSQRVFVRTRPTDMKDVYEIDLRLDRESGDVSSWKRVNRRFINTLRKQFLIWRTISPEDRERYADMVRKGTIAARVGAGEEPAAQGA